MKLSKYGLLLGSLALLASCSNDNITGPDNNTPSGSDFDAAYFTVAIKNPTVRTATPTDSKEAGQAAENKIYTAKLVFGKDGKVVAQSETINIGGQEASSTTAIIRTFKVVNGAKDDDLKGSAGTLDVYVVCNTNQTFSDGGNIQQTMNLASDVDTYWSSTTGFLMSNAEGVTYTLTEQGPSNDETQPTNLGAVKVQRAVARFDVKTSYDSDFTVGDVKVTFDALALVNLSKEFYLFKDVWNETDNKWQLFADETVTNFVNDPSAATKAGLTGADGAYGDHFLYYATEKAPKQMSFTEFASLNGKNAGEVTGTLASNLNNKGYLIWRYATPNSLYEAVESSTTPKTTYTDNNYSFQKNGNSTGIVFRAKLEAAANKTIQGMDAGNVLYAYNNVMYGNAAAVMAIANTPGADENNQRLSALVKAIDGVAITNGSLTNLTDSDLEKLVATDSRFVAYKTENGTNVYYCYYYYWNQHNSTDAAHIMGPMEYAVVRNNIYKLAVSSVSRLGYPGDVNPINPDDPDKPEEDKNAYFKVSINVVDWSVRENDINF